MISVQRFEQWIVPRFCWFDLRFAWSCTACRGCPSPFAIQGYGTIAAERLLFF